MKLIFSILFCFLTIATSWARLGESRDQCVVRYGQPHLILPVDSPVARAESLVFEKDGIQVQVWFDTEYADQIKYSWIENSKKTAETKSKKRFNGRQIQALLSLNISEQFSEIRPYNPEWRNWESNKFFATEYGVQGSGNSELVIALKGAADRIQRQSLEKQAKKGKEELKGF